MNQRLIYDPECAIFQSRVIKIPLFYNPLYPLLGVVLCLKQDYFQGHNINGEKAFGMVDDKVLFNVIDDNITLWGTIRCMHQQMMGNINLRIQRIVTKSKINAGCLTHYFEYANE